MAIPGAGIPRKEVFCVSSMLNLAKRMAEKTGKRKAIQGDKSSPNSMISGCWAWLISQYMMNPGATPNETTSDKRIQVGTDGGVGMEHSRGETVEKVEKSGHENHDGRFDGHS